MSKSGGVLSGEEALESGISLIKKSGKVAVAAVSDSAKAAGSQISGRNQDTQDIVESLYSKSDENPDQKQNKTSNQNPQQPEENTPEEIEKKKKLAQLRQQLHDEVYYDPLVNPKKQQQEERPAEKVEKEKQQETVELEEKKKKEPPPLVQRIQQRVEKFPGASG